jgi:hypothetical protein
MREPASLSSFFSQQHLLRRLLYRAASISEKRTNVSVARCRFEETDTLNQKYDEVATT